VVLVVAHEEADDRDCAGEAVDHHREEHAVAPIDQLLGGDHGEEET
jgi:hypothetical protein